MVLRSLHAYCILNTHTRSDSGRHGWRLLLLYFCLLLYLRPSRGFDHAAPRDATVSVTPAADPAGGTTSNATAVFVSASGALGPAALLGREGDGGRSGGGGAVVRRGGAGRAR